MKQQDFERAHSDSWQALQQSLEAKAGDECRSQLPQLYRGACHQLALARHRGYSPQLIDRLNQLVIAGHHHLYRRSARFQYQFLRFIVRDFPQALRDNSAYVLWSIGLFLLPGLAMWLACFINEDMIYSVMGAADVRAMESMYDASDGHIGRERESDSDLMMFGFYIYNNIGIAFRTFASGILFGLGSIFFLVFNGLHIGSAAGHLTQVGYSDSFYPFVVGHGAFELTAIAFSGAAGLKIGFALLAPGSLTRMDALRKSGREAVIIVYGAALMLLIAAFLEAFWSSSSNLPNSIKYSVGGFFWLGVIYYCLFSGRSNAE
jgi:uncharacterized membrane protein SpoIIM required for sporulation